MDTIKKNTVKLYASTALYNLAVLLLAGSLMQTYLNALGIAYGLIGVFTSFIQIVNVTVSVIFAGLGDKTKRTKQFSVVTIFPILLFAALLLPFCFISGIDAKVIFVLILIGGGIYAAFSALKTIFVYKLPYQLIDMKDYVAFASKEGIISGICSAAAGVLLIFAVRYLPFLHVMACAFITVVVLLVSTAFLIGSMTVGKPDDTYIKEREKNSRGVLGVLRTKSFSALIAPNVARGLAIGVFGMAAVVGLGSGVLSAELSVWLVPLGSAAAVISSLSRLLIKRISNSWFCLLGSVLMCVMPLMAYGGIYVFMAVFAIASIGYYIIAWACPLVVYEIVSYEIISAYSTYRMVLTTAGSAAASFAVGFILGKVPVVYLFAFAALCQLYSGIAYYFVSKSVRRQILIDLRNTISLEMLAKEESTQK